MRDNPDHPRLVKPPSPPRPAVHRYVQHRDANPKGLTAQELEPGSVAAAEVAALSDYLGSAAAQG